MALLHGLIRVKGARPETLIVAHINHGLRGAESDADEDFVIRTSSELGVRYRVRRVEVPNNKHPQGESIEMAARRLRHAALADICREVGVHRMCVAHTADDQVEHFFLRLFRGAGTAGLRGMAWASPSPAEPEVQLMRPLLAMPRDQLRAFLLRLGLGFRNDSSNDDLEVPRNRIRHEVIPALRKVAGPAFNRLVQRSMELVRAEGEFAELAAKQWRGGNREESFDYQHIAIQRIIIRDQLIDCGINPDFERVESLRLPGPRSVSVRGGGRVAKAPSGALAVITEPLEVPKSMPPIPSTKLELFGKAGWVDLPDGGLILWRRLEKVPATTAAPGGESFFDATRLGTSVAFRHWAPGDRICRLGMIGRTKLQDLFVNSKIPRAIRQKLWVGEDSRGEIFWVEGFTTSETHKVHADTKLIIGIRCSRTGPPADPG